MLFAMIAAVVLAMVVVAGLVLIWARSQVSRHQQQDAKATSRQQLLQQAAVAANDRSGRQLLLLLSTLEREGRDCPVTIEWVRRPARDEAPEGVLVKIAWDGNEWRQVHELAPFRDRLTTLLASDPSCESPRARALLADLGQS